MSSFLRYKNYLGRVRVDVEAEVFRGDVVNIRDTITFQGTSLDELKAEFCASVEDYLEFCASRNEAPEKPFSGRFGVRIDPETHRSLSILASLQNQSLNTLVAQHLNGIALKADEEITGGAFDRVGVSGKPRKAKTVAAGKRLPKAVVAAKAKPPAPKAAAAPKVRPAKNAASNHPERKAASLKARKKVAR